METREYVLYAGLYLLTRLLYVLIRKGWPAEDRRCVEQTVGSVSRLSSGTFTQLVYTNHCRTPPHLNAGDSRRSRHSAGSSCVRSARGSMIDEHTIRSTRAVDYMSRLGYHSTFQDIPTLGAGGETVEPLCVILR
jgi:hypothetical protein